MKLLVRVTKCNTPAKDLRRVLTPITGTISGSVKIGGQKLTRGVEITFTESREMFYVKSTHDGYVVLGLRDNEGNEIDVDSVLFADGIVSQVFEDKTAQIIDSSMTEWEVIEEGEFHEQ